MSVTAEKVKALRERSGGGMLDCKKALQEANGDMEKAFELMRTWGTAKAAKKADRIAAEGLIVAEVSACHKQAVIIEINCETDFVARDTNFIHFCEKLAKTALKNKADSAPQLLMASHEGSTETIDTLRQQLIMKIGENINVRRCQYVSAEQGVIGHYIHSGRIGVLVELAADNLSLAKDIAMHIAANNPECISAEDVSQSRKEAEKAILVAQAETSGKPKDIIEKMILGRLQKFVAEISLYGQPFVKNADITVGQLVKEAKTSVISFVRYEVGEGIEKKQEDFAKEVMAQVKGG